MSGVVSNTFPPYPWSSGQQLGAVQLDAAFQNLYALYQNLGNVIGIIQTQGVNGGPVEFNLNWAGGAIVTPGDYVLLLIAPYDFVINNIVYGVGSAGGTFTFSVRNGGNPIPGLSNIIASSQNYSTAIPTGGNAVNAGSLVDVVISSVSSAPTDSIICIQGSRTGNIPNGTITVENAETQTGSSIITDGGLELVFNVLT
jgi:hypothetical protein